MKTFDLAFVGWVTIMTVCAYAVSSLEALSLGVYFIVFRYCYGCGGLKVKLHIVVCCGMIFCHAVLLLFPIIGCVHPSYAEDGLDLT